jgi:hypothetical protein
MTLDRDGHLYDDDLVHLANALDHRHNQAVSAQSKHTTRRGESLRREPTWLTRSRVASRPSPGAGHRIDARRGRVTDQGGNKGVLCIDASAVKND